MLFTTHGQARIVVTGAGDFTFEQIAGTRREVRPDLA